VLEAELETLLAAQKELPKWLQAEQSVRAACKAWLDGLPAGTKLEPVAVIADGHALPDVRKRIKAANAELTVFLEPLGYFETGDFGQLNVHQNQVEAALAGEIERPDAVSRADGMVAVSLQQVVEELLLSLIVLHDHHGLRHSGIFRDSGVAPFR
jgi:hypothetical protein